MDGCSRLPPALRPGCEWRYTWYKWKVSGCQTNNPIVKFRRVKCPSQLTDISGTTPNDDSSQPDMNDIGIAPTPVHTPAPTLTPAPAPTPTGPSATPASLAPTPTSPVSTSSPSSRSGDSEADSCMSWPVSRWLHLSAVVHSLLF